jgi:uncharacterized membrane protein
MIEFLVYIFLILIYIVGVYFSYSHVKNLYYRSEVKEFINLKQKIKLGFVFWIVLIGFPLILVYLIFCLFFYITYSILIKFMKPND